MPGTVPTWQGQHPRKGPSQQPPQRSSFNETLVGHSLRGTRSPPLPRVTRARVRPLPGSQCCGQGRSTAEGSILVLWGPPCLRKASQEEGHLCGSVPVPWGVRIQDGVPSASPVSPMALPAVCPQEETGRGGCPTGRLTAPLRGSKWHRWAVVDGVAHPGAQDEGLAVVAGSLSDRLCPKEPPAQVHCPAGKLPPTGPCWLEAWEPSKGPSQRPALRVRVGLVLQLFPSPTSPYAARTETSTTLFPGSQRVTTEYTPSAISSRTGTAFQGNHMALSHLVTASFAETAPHSCPRVSVVSCLV